MSRRMSNLGVSLFLSMLIVWTITGAALAVEKIGVRAWAHTEFGRIVFDWPSEVRHSAEISGEILTVRFSKKFTADLKPVADKLQRYIFDISIGADGKSIVAKLTSSFKMRSFINEGAIVVDLAVRPRDGSFGARNEPRPVVVTAPKPEAPKVEAKVVSLPKPPPPPPPPPLRVRIGEHQGYNRLVFDWTKAVEYQVGRENGEFDIRFNRAATIDTVKLRESLGDRIASIESANDARGLWVGLRLKNGARVRHFRDGTRVVVDVLAGAATVSPNTKKADNTHASGRPVSLTKLASRKKAKARAERRARNQQIEFGPKAALVTVKVIRRSSSLMNVHFNWRHAVSAAFFSRHGNIWVYFDEASRIDLGGLKALGDGIVESVQQYPVSKGSLVRLSIADGYAPTVTNEDNRWILDIAPRKFRKLKHSIEVKVHTGEHLGPRVIASLPNPGPVVLLRDPEVGDVIGVVPMKISGYGVEKQRRFIDFTLFSSAAGIAYHPMNEGLEVSSEKSRIVMSGPRGLTISRSKDIEWNLAQSAGDRGRQLWNIRSWGRGSSAQIEELRKKLIRHVINVPSSKRNDARIELAKFYLSHGGAADALGIVAVVLRQKPTREQSLTLRSLSAAGNYLLRHYGKAELLFDEPNLRAEQGAIPWLAALAAAKGDWRDAHNQFLGAGKVLKLYPAWLQRRFYLLAAESALVSGKSDDAKSYLMAVRNLAPLPEQMADLDYLRGYLLKQAGKLDDAKRLWATLVDSKNRPARAKAIFALIEADLEQKKIDRPEAIKRLEKLSFAWRGDVFEFDLLRRLGELHIAGDSYREGFTKLRQAASYFKKVGGAEGVTALMHDHFKKLYLGGAADKLPPVIALALFEEFRELAPAGSEGDEMIRKLADRLAKVDLLDEAAKLLDHQVEFRLDGAEKARIGVRAAVIRLLDNKPEKALAVLVGSQVADMPIKLERQRRYLKSNILGKLGRLDEAMTLLGDDYSDKAEKTRASISWRMSKWQEASAVLQRIMSRRVMTPDDAEGARFVVQWVIARAMLGDNAGIEALRNRFGPVMAKTAQAKPFKVLVGNDLDGIANYPALIKAAGDIDRLQAFMGEYRSLVRDEDLSAIN